jgi:4-hydroxy-tetrahydrodipicolinate synthase
MTLPLLAIGAVGLVGTTTHWTAQQFAQLIQAFQRGEVEQARQINARLLESFEFVNSDESVFSMSIKAMLRALGQEVGDCRLPLLPAPTSVRARAVEVWDRLNR